MCGSKDHMIKYCPHPQQDTGSGRTPIFGDAKSNQRNERQPPQPSANRCGTQFGAPKRDSSAPIRTYALMSHEKADTCDLVTGTFSITGSPAYTLLDLGSILSYSYSGILEDKG